MPAATALIQTLAWETLYAAGAALERKKKKKEEKKKKGRTMAFLIVPAVPTVSLANLYLPRPALLQAKAGPGEWGGEMSVWEKGLCWL